MEWHIYLYINEMENAFKYYSIETDGILNTGNCRYGSIGTGGTGVRYGGHTINSRASKKEDKGYILSTTKSTTPQPSEKEVLQFCKDYNIKIPIDRYIKAFGRMPDSDLLKEYEEVLEFDETITETLKELEEFY